MAGSLSFASVCFVSSTSVQQESFPRFLQDITALFHYHNYFISVLADIIMRAIVLIKNKIKHVLQEIFILVWNFVRNEKKKLGKPINFSATVCSQTKTDQTTNNSSRLHCARGVKAQIMMQMPKIKRQQV